MAKNLSPSQFKDLMNNVPKAVAEELRSAILEGGSRFVSVIKSGVPQGVDGRNELLESIKMISGRHPLQVRVVAGGELTTRQVRKGINATYDYALANEFGTENMRAQPYFWPGYRLGKRPIKSKIARRTKKAIERLGIPLK